MLKQPRVYIVLVIAILTIVICIVAYQLYDTTFNGISSFDGKSIADDLVSDWHDDALLIQVVSIYSEQEGGLTGGWMYTYFSPSTIQVDNNITSCQRIEIYVYANQTIRSSNGTEYIFGEISDPITNWTIDSTQAYEIAADNPEIASFLQRYRNTEIGSSLWVREAYPDGATWHFLWQDWGFMDDPHSAEIYIDANTGEVLYVDADG